MATINNFGDNEATENDNPAVDGDNDGVNGAGGFGEIATSSADKIDSNVLPNNNFTENDDEVFLNTDEKNEPKPLETEINLESKKVETSEENEQDEHKKADEEAEQKKKNAPNSSTVTEMPLNANQNQPDSMNSFDPNNQNCDIQCDKKINLSRKLRENKGKKKIAMPASKFAKKLIVETAKLSALSIILGPMAIVAPVIYANHYWNKKMKNNEVPLSNLRKVFAPTNNYLGGKSK